MNASKSPLPALLGVALSLLATCATAAPAVGQDGWTLEHGYSVYVGTPGTVGKTRAQVQRELAEYRAHRVGADGWSQDDSGYVHFTGTPAESAGKTRAQVQMELAEFRKNPVSADGWRQEDDGYSVYVGTPKPAGATAAASLATRAQ